MEGTKGSHEALSEKTLKWRLPSPVRDVASVALAEPVCIYRTIVSELPTSTVA